MKQDIKYITYRINGMYQNHTPVAVDCTNLSKDEIKDIYADAHSLHGLGNLRINTTGKVRKDIMIISKNIHYKYQWDKISKDYYKKCFSI